MERCKWVKMTNPLYVSYHDLEWGKPVYDDKTLYEMLILESYQAGLSWECVLNKREAFRKAYDNFDIDKIVNYDDNKLAQLAENKGIIRNKRKIAASVTNSVIFKNIQKEFGSFSNYLWSFTDNEVISEEYYIRTTSPLSDEISKDLIKRGMKFVGSTIIYSYLQAIGVINGHGQECELCKKRK